MRGIALAALIWILGTPLLVGIFSASINSAKFVTVEGPFKFLTLFLPASAGTLLTLLVYVLIRKNLRISKMAFLITSTVFLVLNLLLWVAIPVSFESRFPGASEIRIEGPGYR